MAIRLMVADDQEVIRKGLARLLAGEDIQIVAEAATSAEAIATATQCKPDVLLLDVQMPDMDGVDALEQIRENSPTTKVIMISAYDNSSHVARAVAQGAVDFLLKDVPAEEFENSVRRSVRGEAPPADALFSTIKAKLQVRPDPKRDDVPLTRREYQVLKHLGYGLSNREIARSLNISVETVKEHVQHVLRKLAMPDRTAVAVWIVKRGLA